jgi:hypothetical protein
MAIGPAPDTDPAYPDRDTWPWRCLGCTATIYHDGVYCANCVSHRAVQRTAVRRRGAGSFRAWIRDQSYPKFVSTVATVASLEVALTALWLHLLLDGPPRLLSLLPAV